MKTIGDALFVLNCCVFAASWVKYDYLRWEAFLLYSLIPLFFWWKGGAFKKVEK